MSKLTKRIRLLFPYEKIKEVIDRGGEYDDINRYWYYDSCDGLLPTDLKPYKAHLVYIPYENKDYLRPILTSMIFDKNKQSWIVNQKDYIKLLNMNSRDENLH